MTPPTNDDVERAVAWYRRYLRAERYHPEHLDGEVSRFATCVYRFVAAQRVQAEVDRQRTEAALFKQAERVARRAVRAG